MLAVVGGGQANFPPSICVSYWGAPNFTRAYGTIYPVLQILGASGAFFVVQMAAYFGGYNAVYIGMMILCAISFVVFSMVKNADFVKKAEERFAKEDN